MNGTRGVRTGTLGLVLVSILALAGSCQRKPAEGSAAAGSAADSLQQARLAAGQVDYLTNCAMCHGEWGLGDGPLAPQLQKESGAVPAHLNDRARRAAMGRDTLIQVIALGGAHTGRSNLMPAWGERLPREEIERIADFVMSLPELHREIPPSTLSRFLDAPPGVASEGRKLFVTMCSACHGPFGKGDGRYADTMFVRNKVRPRDLTDSLYFAAIPDREVFASISLGGGFFHKSPFMPMWSATLTPEQIKHLVTYIRALSRTASRS
jgi:mono/diheme cytochrome c family protein